tara:strand:+ start:1156 stop:1770 length:615 start_codon:yes stop_codon:yes gene_type:complete
MPSQKVSKTPSKKSVTAAPKRAPAKKAATPVSQPVAAPVVTETAPVENEVVAVPFGEVMASMNAFQANLQSIINSLNQLKSEYKALEKKVQREARVTQKAMAKRKKKSGTRAPSGFVKPTRISNELASFLQKPQGTEMARTSVTKEINTYIKEHNLKDPKNGRIIHPDAKLSKLLNVTKADEVTYFNLQKYMSHHFEKASSTSA